MLCLTLPFTERLLVEDPAGGMAWLSADRTPDGAIFWLNEQFLSHVDTGNSLTVNLSEPWHVRVTLLDVSGRRHRLGFSADRRVRIWRESLWKRLVKQGQCP